MHVLIVTKQYGHGARGGVGVVATSLAGAYRRRGHRVTVVTGLHHGYRGTADIIHAHSYLVSGAAVGLRRRLGVPLVYTCHSFALHDPPGVRRRMIARQVSLFRCARRIVVPSRWAYGIMARHYRAYLPRTIIIPNGVSFPARPASRSPAANLLYVGRTVCSKGLPELIGALAILRRKWPDVHLTVVGYDTGGQRRRLQQMATRLGVGRRIRWLGGRTHTATVRLYRRYGAVVMPSRREAFGLVALEALAQGAPLVATRNSGLSDFVSTRVAAVIPAVNARTIAASVSSLLRNPRLTKVRVANGRRLARHYGLGVVASRYLHLFVELRRPRTGKF